MDPASASQLGATPSENRLEHQARSHSLVMHEHVTNKLTTLCFNQTLSSGDFVDVIMGDIPYNHTVFEWYTFMC